MVIGVGFMEGVVFYCVKMKVLFKNLFFCLLEVGEDYCELFVERR